MEEEYEYVCNGDYCELVTKDVEKNTASNDTLETALTTLPQSDASLPKPSQDIEWLVYGASWCRFCRNAKKFLESKNVDLVYVEIENYVSKDVFKEMMTELTSGYQTIPMIFNREKFIGGYSNLCELFEPKSK